MTYVLICPFSYEMTAAGRLFVFLFGLHVLTEQNTKLTTLCLSPTFFSGDWGCLFTSIKFRSQGITRSDGNRITSAFSKCGLWASGDDFPFLTSCKIWVLINLTFGFIVCRGHTRMRMKPASWEERGHYRVVSRSVGPSSQGCTHTCRSWVWWEPYRWHTPASVHLFTPGISPLTFA